MNKKGQMGGRIMLVIFDTILIVAVAIPIVTSLLDATTFTVLNASGNCTVLCNETTNNIDGLPRTIVGFIPVFLALAGLSLAATLAS